MALEYDLVSSNKIVSQLYVAYIQTNNGWIPVFRDFL